MKRIIFSLVVLLGVTAAQAAKPRTSLQVYSTKKQTITGFGGACCDGAMKPFGTDNACVSKLYGAKSKIGLNILRCRRLRLSRSVAASSSEHLGRLPASIRLTAPLRVVTLTIRETSGASCARTAMRSSSRGLIPS